MPRTKGSKKPESGAESDYGVSSDIGKNPAKQDSPPAAGRVSDILPLRRSAIIFFM